MLRRFGNVVWRQSRDMSVLNYPGHIVYEIYTNHGYIYVSQDKTSQKIEVFNGVANGVVDFEKKVCSKEQSKEVFFPVLQ